MKKNDQRKKWENPDKIIIPDLPEITPLPPEPKPEKEKIEPFNPIPEISPVPLPDIKPEDLND